jgi:hypothetical protein
MRGIFIYLSVVVIPAFVSGFLMQEIVPILGIRMDKKSAWILGAALYLILIRFKGWRNWP